MRLAFLGILLFAAGALFTLWIPAPQKTPLYTCLIPIARNPAVAKPAHLAPLPSKKPPKFLGETITYDVRFKGISMGKARFHYEAYMKLNARPALKMTLTTRLSRFFDEETIYGDPETFLPIKIERNIVNLFSKENITEEYDQSKYTVSITKSKGGKKEMLEFKKDTPIQNPILLPHYVRQIPKLAVGSRFSVTLPTRTFEIVLASIEEVITPAGTFKAYHFESHPKQIEIWMTADERRIPIKMRGTGVFGYTMVMEKYQN